MPTRDDQLRGIEIEKDIRNQIPRPQFPHGNYIGMMDELALDLNLFRGDDTVIPSLSLVNGVHIVTPFAYTPPSMTNENPMMEEMHSLISQCHRGHLRSRVVFQNMIGHWNFAREITNFYDPAQSGQVIGTASFLPAPATCLPEDEAKGHFLFDGMKYREDGVFTMTNRTGTSSFTIQREDLYTYQPINDTIEIHFLKNSKKEKHFLTLRFREEPGESPREEIGAGLISSFSTQLGYDEKDKDMNHRWWRAESDHWCSPDTYKAIYQFQFEKIHLQQIIIEMKCQGPTKDYSTKTIYTRPNPISS
jgi:hypothetical protein